MGRGPVEHRADGYDPVRVYGLMAVMVMARDMVEIHRLRHTRPLVEFADVGPERGVVDDPLAVALEMPVIDRVEPDERREEAPVGLGDAVAREVALTGQARFECIELR